MIVPESNNHSVSERLQVESNGAMKSEEQPFCTCAIFLLFSFLFVGGLLVFI